ncbi:MAG: hypothetical protein Q8P68_01405 [Candidatus Peregrinibacteria bacterium]|nr:hypothetical protein [Candidatus Peregrinibacteria bacterium]
MPLCKSHERLAHAGLIENEEGSPVKLGHGVALAKGTAANVVINWAIKEEADKAHPKYQIDKKVGAFYVH